MKHSAISLTTFTPPPQFSANRRRHSGLTAAFLVATLTAGIGSAVAEDRALTAPVRASLVEFFEDALMAATDQAGQLQNFVDEAVNQLTGGGGAGLARTGCDASTGSNTAGDCIDDVAAEFADFYQIGNVNVNPQLDLELAITVTDPSDRAATAAQVRPVVSAYYIQQFPPNQPPEANAGDPQSVAEGSQVTLDGSDSSDLDVGDDVETYTWSQTGSPTAAQTIAFGGQDTSTPVFTFTAPMLGATDTELTLTFSLSVNDGDDDSATTDTVVITVTPAGIADTLNAQVLPQIARVLTSQINANIAQRVEIPRVPSGGVGGATFNFGGATMTNGADNSAALPTWLAQHGEDLVAGEMNMKSLLANSSFEMPLSLKQVDGGQSSNLALWGRGNYRSIEDSSSTLAYDGDAFGLSVGVDAPLGERGLGGVALSWSDSEIDYEGANNATGKYQFELVSVHPYFGWREGSAEMWASIGYGEGSLEVMPASGAKQDSDVSMQSLAAGGSGRIMQTADGATELRGKGEVSIARLEVEDSDVSTATGIDVGQVRLALEATHTRELRGGASLQPSAEIGIRYDSGDGENEGKNTGIALRAGVKRIGGRLTLEGNVHGLFARGDYKEWGVDGMVSMNPGRDGQGLSFTVAPGLGDTTSEVERLWQQDLRHSVPTNANDADDIAPRLRASVGYGLTHKWQPYGEMTLANDNNRYGLGVRWQVKQAHGVGFHLNLLGEHRDTDTAAANAILLQGKVEF